MQPSGVVERAGRIGVTEELSITTRAWCSPLCTQNTRLDTIPVTLAVPRVNLSNRRNATTTEVTFVTVMFHVSRQVLELVQQGQRVTESANGIPLNSSVTQQMAAGS